MDNREAVNWLINISADIGKAEHSDLWHYEQALTEIKDMLESAQLSLEGTTKDATSDTISRQAAIDAIAGCTNCRTEEVLREYVAMHNLDNMWSGGVLEAIDAVKDLPSVQPEERTMEEFMYGQDMGNPEDGSL